MKMQLKSNCFKTVFEIQRELHKVLHSLMESDFWAGLRAWEERWDQCIAAQGDNFEGDNDKT